MITAREGLRYGLMGLPLAFAALPLYVHMPARYAAEFGVSLAALGAVLLGARLFDAVLDPWIGRIADRLFSRSAAHVLALSAVAAAILAASFALLMFPPVRGDASLLAWAAATLVLTCTACSAITVAHQAWGAMLAEGETQRAQVVGWREGFALVGVLMASVLPTVVGWPATAAVLALALAAGCFAWTRSRRPLPTAVRAQAGASPFANARFRQLLAVFMLNGIATAVPATLLLFFVQDRLRAPPSLQPIFLGAYFLFAALSLPAWVRLVARFGLARTWLAGMVLAVAVFAWAAALGEGDAVPFIAVCILCGIALGADLAAPAALLAGVIAQAGAQGRGEGLFFGWWQFASKLNLALAAGLALPLLQLAGYAPGAQAPAALHALTLAYCVLPCIFKVLAAALLYTHFIRRSP